MSNFCGNCGTASSGTAFCGQCGSPLAAPAAPTAPGEVDERTVVRPRATPSAPLGAPPSGPYPPGPVPTGSYPPGAVPSGPVPTGQWGAVPTQQFPGGGAGPVPPYAAPPPPGVPGPAPRAVPTVNPFVGTPASDFVKDAAVLLLVFLSLGAPWSTQYLLVERWWAVVSLLVSLVGLAVPYVVASRVVPTLTPLASQGIKAALAAPYVLSVLVALVGDLLTIGDESAAYGLGAGLAGGLAAVLLMVQPRACEEALGPIADGAWRAGTLILVGVTMGATVLTTIGYLVVFGWERYALAYLAVAPLWPLVTLAVAAAALVARRPAGRRVVATVAWSVVTVALVASIGDDVWERGFDTWFTPAPGVWLLALVAAAAVSRGVVRSHGTVDAVQGWVDTSRTALGASAAGFFAAAVAQLLGMIVSESFRAAPIISALLMLVCAVAAGVAALLGSSISARVLVTTAAGVVALLGVVLMVVRQESGDSVFEFSPWSVTTAFALPALAVWSVWGPASVRALAPQAAPVAWGAPPDAYASPPVAGPYDPRGHSAPQGSPAPYGPPGTPPGAPNPPFGPPPPAR